MTDQHRATPEQWADQERYSRTGAPFAVCLLELRARVERLEKRHSMSAVYGIVTPKELTPAPGEQWHVRVDGIQQGPATPTRPAAGSLVERVAAAIDHANKTGETDARAAIREVAAWLREQDPEPGPVGRWLGQISTPCGVMADQLEHEANR